MSGEADGLGSASRPSPAAIAIVTVVSRLATSAAPNLAQLLEVHPDAFRRIKSLKVGITEDIVARSWPPYVRFGWKADIGLSIGKHHAAGSKGLASLAKQVNDRAWCVSRTFARW